MGILDRYVVRQVLAPCVLAIVLVAVLGVANELQERVKLLPVAQMTLGDVARMSLLFLPTIVSYLVPVTFMFGILLAFGRFAQNDEFIAMRAAGIPLKRVLAPVIVVGALLSAGCFLIQDRVQPWAIGRIYRLVFNELPARASIDLLPPGIMHEFADWRVYVGRRDPATRALEEVVVLEPQEDGGATTYYAARARLIQDGGRAWLEMADVHFVPAHAPGGDGRLPLGRLATTRLAVPAVPSLHHVRNRHEYTLGELIGAEEEFAQEVAETNAAPSKRELWKLRQEMAERVALPFACLAVCFVAGPLGARAKRSGRSYTFAVGFAVVLVYYLLQMLSETKSLQPLGVVMARAWVPNVAFLAAGAVLVWRVDRV